MRTELAGTGFLVGCLLAAVWRLRASSGAERGAEPWPVAREELFGAARAWAREDAGEDAEISVAACAEIAERLNRVPGAHFAYFCENGRMTAIVVARYMALRMGRMPTRAELMGELELLELEFIEEDVVAQVEAGLRVGVA